MRRSPHCRLARGGPWLAAVALLTARAAHASDAVGGRERPAVAIEHVTVVDVAQGRNVGPRTVLIADGRIAAVGEPGAVAVPPGAARVDGRGLFLLPALMDLHVHLFNNASRRPPNEWAFPLFVANGVLAVREMNALTTDLPTVARWREAVARGELAAPHVLAAGVAVRGDSPEAARQQVREARAAGADFMKVFSGLPEASWRAALDEARAMRLSVAGHIPVGVDALAAARAGQRSNEHLTQLYEACAARGESFLAARQGLAGSAAARLAEEQEGSILEGFDPGRCEEVAAALAQAGQAQVPTLVLPHAEAQGTRARFADDERWRFLRPDEQARWRMILDHAPAADAGLAERRWQVSRRIVQALHKAGVPLLAGTDAPMPRVYPGWSLHTELELLVGCGLSPAAALRAATLGPAEFLGLDASTGSVAVGKRADLVLLGADPLADIRHARDIAAVVLAGRLLRRPDLDALLHRAAAESAGRR